MTTPEKITALIAVWAFAVSIVSVYFAFIANKTAKKNQAYQILSDTIDKYRSEDMLLAIKGLWEFRKEIKEKLWPGEDHAENLLMPKNWERTLKDELWKNYQHRLDGPEEFPLHHQRRLVGGFYELLAGLYREKVISDKRLFRYWNKETLAIIPEIILPIERPLFKHLYPGTSEVPQIYTLMEDLHDGHPGGEKAWKHKPKRWIKKKFRWIGKLVTWGRKNVSP